MKDAEVTECRQDNIEMKMALYTFCYNVWSYV